MEFALVAAIMILAISIAVNAFFKRTAAPADVTKIVEENARLKAELSQRDIKLGEITHELQNEKTQKDQFAGKNKQLFAELTSLKAEHNGAIKEKDQLSKELVTFKAEEKRKAKEFETRIQQLDTAKIALDEEKIRVRKEDAARTEQEKADRDRMWAEHEEKVKTQLAELCKLPQYNFQTYDNKNLPEGFGGKFKPDFMIEFLGQYVIFDAKVSRSDNLQNYMSNNVKSTVEKINKSAKIHSMVFFVVPDEAMESLTKTRFYEQSYEFFVIPPAALPVVLASFKKISSYELAEQLDPRDRENIVNLIAEFDYHINMRNTFDILCSQSGIAVLEKAGSMRKDIKDEISRKKSEMRLPQFAPTEIKTVMLDRKVQLERIDEMTAPKAAITKAMMDAVRPIVKGK